MKALSIRQPWAWLITNGYKDIENRTWSTRFRGRVLIHASKGMTRAEYEDVEDYLMFGGFDGMKAIRLPAMADLERGGIVGVATVSNCIPSQERLSPWHMEGQFGFHLTDAKALPLVACKGALGFFDIPPDVAAILRVMRAPAARCHAARDGECSWAHCPQIRDGEPVKSGRHCPHDKHDEDE
ncbi:hypothetical protein OKW43_000019 [Paraburkholderia sp. WC7.3g]|uniref:ASCH domain-containing protein n=1 Tax=Paraburkholderia sp. WC7.3g TaxID=2991070 RepID=UPI003D1FCEE4